MGKTTSTRTICMKWSRGELLAEHFKLVVLISLRDRNVSTLEHLFKFGAIDDEDPLHSFISYVKKTSGKGVLFVIDGFDELSPDERVKDSLCLEIIRGNKLKKCSVIVTSRPHASECLIEQKINFDSYVELLGFDREQIHSCIKSSSLDDKAANDLITKLDQRKTILSLCNVPLNCAIVISIYKQFSAGFPDTHTELFQHFIWGMLKRHAIGVLRGEILSKELDCPPDSDLPSIIEESLHALGELAYKGVCQNSLVFTYREIKSCFPKEHDCHKSKQPIEHFCLGLLTSTVYITVAEDIAGEYQFLHSTIQEYLAARYCSMHNEHEDSEDQVGFLRKYIFNHQFKQFAYFYAGLTKTKKYVLENMFCFKVTDILRPTDFLTYSHVIFESKEFCAYQMLYHTLSDKSMLSFCDMKLSPVDCTVIAHFLCYTGMSWKKIDFQHCYLNSESIDNFRHVCSSSQYKEKSIAVIECIDLSGNQQELIYNNDMHKFPWLSGTKCFKAHCEVNLSKTPHKLHLGLLTSIPELDIKTSVSQKTLHQAFVNSKEVILQSVDTETLKDFNLDSIETLSLKDVKQSLVRSALSYVRKSKSQLRSVTFDNCTISVWNDFVSAINSIKSLTDLNLINVGINSVVAKEIFEVLKCNTVLKHLNLSGNPIGACSDPTNSCQLKIKELLSVNNSLESLKLLDINANDEIISSICSGLLSNSSLKIIDLNNNENVSIQSAVELILSIHMSGLTSIKIHGVEATLPYEMWHLKIGILNCQKLDMFCALCKKSQNGDLNSLAVQLVTSVTMLDLRHVVMSQSLETEFLRLKGIGLETLKLEMCDISDVLCESLSTGLAENVSLKKLFLFGNRISNKGACMIFESLVHNKYLEVLDMSSNNIHFWKEDVCESLQMMMSGNETLKLLNLAEYKSLDGRDTISGRILHVNIKSVPHECACSLGKLFQSLFAFGFTCVKLTENNCLLEKIGDSWSMKCRCFGYSWSSEQSSHCLKFMFSRDCESLRTVDLSNASILTYDAVFIFKSLLEDNCFVKHLDLSNSAMFWNEDEQNILGSALRTVLQQGSACRLQLLNLTNCGISDIACKFIADGLAQNESLSTLDLSRNSITSSGATSIFESLKSNSILNVLSLANNAGISNCDKSLKSALEYMLSINTGLEDLNLLGVISGELIEGIANALSKDHKSILKVLQIDITALTTEAIQYLIEAISKSPHLRIKGPSSCFTFKEIAETNGQINSITDLKIFCAMHHVSSVNLSDTFVEKVHTLNLSYLEIDAYVAISLFRCLEDNTCLKELNLFQNIHFNVLTESNNPLVGQALGKMLSKNVTLKYLNLCNVISSNLASGLINGLKKNKSLQVLHIDIWSIQPSQVAELLNSFSSSKLIHVNIESVGILHSITGYVANQKYWCGLQHYDIHSIMLFHKHNSSPNNSFQSQLTLLPPHFYSVFVNSQWCLHLRHHSNMLPQFYTSLIQGMEYEIVCDILSSIKTVELNATYVSHDVFETFMSLSRSTCHGLQFQRIRIGYKVRLTETMAVALFETNPNLNELILDAPIGGKTATIFAQQIQFHSNLKILEVNIECLSIPTVAKLIQSVETSNVEELKLIPLSIFKQEPLVAHSWHMKIMKSGTLDHVHRLYEHIHQNSNPMKCSIFNTLVIQSRQSSDLSESISLLKSLESNRYPFLKGLHLGLFGLFNDEDSDKCCQIYNTIANILSHPQCKVEVLKVESISESVLVTRTSKILFGLRKNNSLTALHLSGESKEIELIELIHILQNKSTLIELYIFEDDHNL